jgi:hypothetical protein
MSWTLGGDPPASNSKTFFEVAGSEMTMKSPSAVSGASFQLRTSNKRRKKKKGEEVMTSHINFPCPFAKNAMIRAESQKQSRGRFPHAWTSSPCTSAGDRTVVKKKRKNEEVEGE